MHSLFLLTCWHWNGHFTICWQTIQVQALISQRSWKQCLLPWLSQHWQRGRFTARHTNTEFHGVSKRHRYCLKYTLVDVGGHWCKVSYQCPQLCQLVINGWTQPQSWLRLGTAVHYMQSINLGVTSQTLWKFVNAEYQWVLQIRHASNLMHVTTHVAQKS